MEKGGVMPRRLPGRAIFALAVVLASLTMVAWRQSTAHETMEELDAAARELAVVIEERERLARELAAIEARPWIGAEAAKRLGMRAPNEDEVVITSGGSR